MIESLALGLAASVLLMAFYEILHQRRQVEHWKDEAAMADGVRRDLAWKLESIERIHRREST